MTPARDGRPSGSEPELPADDPIRVDTTAIAGFTFTCRPDCGLCCYASPRVSPFERASLLSILPEVPWGEAMDRIDARPEGGACPYLSASRCRVHSVRPAPCAEYPLSVHLGQRAQVCVVLTCPGVSLSGLDPASGGGGRLPPSLKGEVDALVAELGTLDRREFVRARRAWERALRQWFPGALDPVLGQLRSSLRTPDGLPTADQAAEEPLPEESEGIERLPLFFDPRYGRVALASSGSGVDLLTVREEGGVGERLASLGFPDRRPRLEEDARELLYAYLDYFSRRDAFLGAVMVRLEEEPGTDPQAALSDDLRRIAGAVLTRGVWRAQLAGRTGESLTREELGDGIRAADADYLDRPTAGAWL